ncbi:MAG: glycosyltransferase family 2 protein [Candidatus Woesearchaeota archaeon]
MDKTNISIVIPVINGERFLTNTVERIESYLSTFPQIDNYEIIIAAQESKDKTINLAKKLQSDTVKAVILQEKGKWRGLKAGFKEAKYPWLVMIDSDLSYPIEFLEEAIKHQDAHIVIGSRYIKGVHRERIPPIRKFLSWGYRTMVRMLFGIKQRDIQVGCKLIKKKILDNIQIEDNSWVGDTELLYKAAKLGYNIKEIPIHYSFVENELDVRKAIPRMLVDMLKLRMRLK